MAHRAGQKKGGEMEEKSYHGNFLNKEKKGVGSHCPMILAAKTPRKKEEGNRHARAP